MNLSDVGTAVATELLAQTGSEWSYKRLGKTPATITFYKSDSQPIVVDNGGSMTEVIVVTFRGLMSDLDAFGTPIRNDKITNGDVTFEVRPIADKCYYTVGGMVHIHTVQVAN